MSVADVAAERSRTTATPSCLDLVEACWIASRTERLQRCECTTQPAFAELPTLIGKQYGFILSAE